MAKYNSREEVHETKSTKKIRLRKLSSEVSFEKFAIAVDLPISYLRGSCACDRRSQRRKDRHKIGVFLSESEKKKNQEMVSFDRNTIFVSNEKRLFQEYKKIDASASVGEYKELLHSLSRLVPGSGLAHRIIREIAEKFFFSPEEDQDHQFQRGVHIAKIS